MRNKTFKSQFTSTSTSTSWVKRLQLNNQLPKFMYQVTYCGYEYNHIGYYHKRTGGTTYLLAYTKSGSAKLTYNHHEYTIIPNSLTFINLGEDSIIEAINNDWDIYFIHLFGAEVDDI